MTATARRTADDAAAMVVSPSKVAAGGLRKTSPFGRAMGFTEYDAATET
jgi:hypothetical protein